MEVRCPACTRQVNVAQAAPGATLQCPYCGGMFQLAAPQPAAVGAYGAPPPMFASPPAPTSQPALPTPDAIVAYRKPSPRRQRKNDSGMLLALGVLFVGLVAVLIGVGVWLSKRDASPAAASNPADPVSLKARELVSAEMKLAPGAQFSHEEDRIQKLPNDRYRVSGSVVSPSRVGGVQLRQKWIAQIVQISKGEWELERLEVDGQKVTAGIPAPAGPSRFNERSRWLTGDDNDSERSVGGSQTPGVDRSTRWAVDRVAEDIREAAKLRKTLVVWLIDRSASARPQHRDFLQSVDSVLKEMRGNKGEDASLSMAVVSFGSDVQFPLEQPTSDADEVRKALESIEEDASGQELPFTAIAEAAEKFGSFRAEKGGYVVFVVLSDEIGDDANKLDETAALVKQQQIVVHTIGVSAPFGLAVAEGQKGLEGGASGGPSLVRQGPESRHAEMISLALLSGGTVELDSGFGPFSLSRLCHEAGGRYLACKDHGVAAGAGSWGGGAGNPVFQPAAMIKYAPDYVSDQAYQQILASNKACQALHDAAKLPYADVLQTANTTFPKRDEASFKRSVDTAQRDAAKFEPRLRALYDTLKKGESDRAKLTRLRWQAAYDLAMGRASAALVKTEGYNQMLAKIKAAGNFTKPGANTWVLNESDTIGAGSTFEKMLAQSREYLQRVTTDHPGTPWAYLAERELAVNAGWQWSEQ